MKTRMTSIRIYILLPIVLVIAVLLSALVIEVQRLQHDNIHKKQLASLGETEKFFKMELDEEADLFSSVIDFLKQDKNLQGAWLAKDRKALLDYATPIFENIRSKHRVTHFYFHDLDRVCFLRVHHPPRHGDYIERATMAGAAQEGKAFDGIELGIFGTFTLRVVHPWRIDGKLVGYIEIGEETEHITKELKDILGSELIFVIEKTFLDRGKWEEGLQMIGKTGNWDQFADVVIIDSSIEKLPSAMCTEIQQHLVEHEIVEHEKVFFEISVDRDYLGGFIALYDAGGTEVGEIIVLNDVTEVLASGRKTLLVLITISVVSGLLLFVFFYIYIGRIERKLANVYDAQQREIAERKKAEQQLEAAKHKADTANIAKSRFLANMSHEIRTPMNIIIGFNDLLADEEMTADQKAYSGFIKNASNSLLGIIDDILDYSRIEAGKLEVSLENCSLKKLLEDIDSMMRLLTDEKGLEFKVIGDEKLPLIVSTDTGRVRQCLVNLINNAIKFTDQGYVHLKVSLQDKDRKPFIRFDVEDTGIGIPEDMQEYIFASFAQVDETNTRLCGGTGLGLAITKQLTKLLGGELTLTSHEGKGSVFSLLIPAGVDIKSQPSFDKNETVCKSSPANETATLSGKVLVVEDIKESQLLVKKILKPLGLKVTLADDGNQAIEKARQQRFDLILMDMQMPVLNGYEATKVLRQDGITTPIVALTAYAMESNREKCFEAGCDDYITKPVDRNELLKMLSKYLSPDRQGQDQSVSQEIDAMKDEVDKLSGACAGAGRLDEQQAEPPRLQDSDEVIDWNELVRRGMDENIIEEVTPTFLEGKQERLDKMTKAVEAGNAKDIELCAHALKGGAANIGAKRLSTAAAELELMASQEDLSKSQELLERIKKEFQKFESFVSEPNWIEKAKTQAGNGK